MNAESPERPRQSSRPRDNVQAPRALRVSFNTPASARRPVTPRNLWKLWSIRRFLRHPQRPRKPIHTSTE